MQRLSFHVKVQKRDLTAHLTESEPNTDEIRLVPHEKSHDISTFKAAVTLKHVCESVTPLVHISVRQDLIFKHDERFIWTLSGLKLKVVQIRDDTALHPRHHRPPDATKSRVIHQVTPKVRVKLHLEDKQGENPHSQRAYDPT